MKNLSLQSKNKIAILSVGTELTNGQIINKNASWLSEKMAFFGYETTFQLTVPDDRSLIDQALTFCAQNASVIFITGGLGPTSDDFTREVIASWTKLKLQFDETSWQHTQQRLTSRGFTVKEIQRQQCYFPEGSTVLTNSQGTAHGFKIKLSSQSLVVLPGPPREIEAIWNDHLHSYFLTQSQLFDKKITKSWDTLGLGESDIATLTEGALKDHWPDLKFEVGYRVHLPYVEVKLSYYKSQENLAQSLVHNISKALFSYTVLQDFNDITDIFSQKTKNSQFTFYDFVSNGFLHHRLSIELKKFKNWKWMQSDHEPLSADFFSSEENFLALLPSQENENEQDMKLKALILGEYQGQFFQTEITAPMTSPLMKERREQYFSEMALLEFCKKIKLN